MTTASGTSSAAPVGKITIPAASIIPQGVGAPPPPGLDPKKGKLMCIKVRMLDDTVGVFHLGHKAVGQALFDEVCRHLNLLECDYFGLEFLDCFGNRCWLDKEKSILKQISLARSDARFYFVVKFYTPTPADLEEEYTRYLFALQMKRDLASGQFVCNENTAALMASYIVQSECGDFSSDDYHDHTYLSAVRFVPSQSVEFEKKVMDNHKKLIGMSPAESDLALLETARRSEFYGVKFHGARDIEGTPVSLAVLHLGIKVYHQLSCASTFSWAKLRKLSFKRKKLFIKLLPESCVYYKDTIEFSFETRNECKMFWKKAVEHHAFFRCSDTIPASKHQSKFFTKGSSFRYTGRTQRQLIDYVREHHKRREPFTRPLHSSKTKKIDDERLLPTPSSSLPGTLVRENGNLSISAAASASLNRETRFVENYQQVPAYAANTPAFSEHDVHLQQWNEQVVVNDQISQAEDTAKWGVFAGNNNDENYAAPPPTTIIPPTPDTPQLKRKAVKGLAAPAVTKQQITFHFPVTEISPDSPSSTSDFGARIGGDSGIQTGGGSLMPDDRFQAEEWAAPPTPSSPTLPPMSPGGDGEGGEEDNVSEDSYHLAENEQIAVRIQQQAFFGQNRPYISTSLPMSALRRRDDSRGCTCSDQLRQPAFKTFGDRPTASTSLDIVYPSNSQPAQRFQPRDIEIRRSPESSQRSPTRGLTGPLPGRVLPKGPLIIARTKPIPPPKPKMGLVHLERSARGDYATTPATTSQASTSPSTEPLVISQSTITTTEITVKKIVDVCEPAIKAEVQAQEAKAKKDAAEEGVTKKVAFVTPESPSREGSVDDSSVFLPAEHSPSPAAIINAIFPSDTDLVSIAAVPPPLPPIPPVPVIEVQSEECPEIKHKFVNGDIPYILHVRHVNKTAAEQKPEDFASPIGSATFSTFKEPPAAKTVSQEMAVEVNADRSREQTPLSRDSPEASTGQPRTVGRRKSFDLVPRKRLPSPASFSSQDHSVSPDSEHDVAGYVSKFRGGLSKKGDAGTLEKRSSSKRTDPRRMTQPIAAKPMILKPRPARSQPCIPDAGADEDESADELVKIEAPSFHEGMDLLEKMDDGDRFSVNSAGELLEISQRVVSEPRTNTAVRFAPNTLTDPPFIDDRASSESLVAADYDNLPPIRRPHQSSTVATSRKSPQTSAESGTTKLNGQRPSTGL